MKIGIHALIVGVAVTLTYFALSLASAQAENVEADGGDVYSSTCASCHQGGGQGIPGVFPPLSEHVSRLVQAEGGRPYVLGVVLFGLQGEIEVEDTTYDGTMPSWQSLGDQEVAAVLNHVAFELSGNVEVDDVEPFTAMEVADARENPRSPQEMHALRPDRSAIVDEDASSSEPPTQTPTFTRAQADRGMETYRDRCTECHGGNLGGGVVGGPPLRGTYFEQRWEGRSVAELFEYTRARMPQDRPRSLSDRTYADLVAMILRENGMSPGPSELPSSADALRGFVIESR